VHKLVESFSVGWVLGVPGDPLEVTVKPVGLVACMLTASTMGALTMIRGTIRPPTLPTVFGTMPVWGKHALAVASFWPDVCRAGPWFGRAISCGADMDGFNTLSPCAGATDDTAGVGTGPEDSRVTEAGGPRGRVMLGGAQPRLDSCPKVA